MTSATATLAACLTPPGRGAIGTLAVRGPRAWEIVRGMYRPLSPSRPPLPEEPQCGRIWLGRLGAELADEVVISSTRAAPIPWVEVHCHGGPEVVRMLLEAFESRGVTICSWQELERRTADAPARSAAAAELVRAPTTRTAAVLLDQYHGAFERALQIAQAALERKDLDAATRLLNELAEHAPLGRHLTTPWRVVVAGAPNVGKSSLVNALAGFQRSVVAATPGTTRDVVTTLIAVDGWPVELADTAGLRLGAGSLEGQGIELARSAATAADLCLWVLDASAAPVWPDFSGIKMHYAINKTDLPAAWDLGQADAVRVSTKSGAGLANLCQHLANWLVPEPPPAGAAVPFTAGLCDRVEETYCALGAGQPAEALKALEAARKVLIGLGSF